MIVKKTDPISGRRLDFEVPEPFPGLQDLGANESLLFPGDVLRSDVSYKDFPEDITKRESYQLLPFYQELKGAAGTTPAGWWETIWTSLTDLVTWVLENPGTVDSILETLVKYGIITTGEKTGMEGLTKEQVAAMIEAKLGAAPAWEKYLPWLIGGGLGLALVIALVARGRAPVYIVPERR